MPGKVVKGIFSSIWKAGTRAERESRSLGLHAENSWSQLCPREQQLLTSR